MATLNQLALPGTLASVVLGTQWNGSCRIQNESVSGNTGVGLNVSNRAVPAGRYWLVRTMRLNTAEVGKNYEFYADDGATSHLAWHDPASMLTPAVASESLGWVASEAGVLLPPGWRVGIKIDGAAGALNYNWQYFAIELQLDQ